MANGWLFVQANIARFPSSVVGTFKRVELRLWWYVVPSLFETSCAEVYRGRGDKFPIYPRYVPANFHISCHHASLSLPLSLGNKYTLFLNLDGRQFVVCHG